MENLEEQLSQELNALEQGETTHSEAETTISPEQTTTEPTSETMEEPVVEIEGQKFTISELQQYLDKAKKYEHLLPEFTRRSQKLKELERQLKEQNIPQELAELKKLLREKLEVLTKQDLAEAFEQLAIKEEEKRKEEALQYLAEKYDGKKFPIKFDYNKVVNYIREKYGGNMPEYIDLETEFIQMNLPYFEKLVEQPKSAIPTERAIPSSITAFPSKKIVDIPEKEDEISLEEALYKTLEEL